MGLGVADHLSFCVASNRVIFLDHRAQRYFCLGSAGERAVFRLLHGDEPSDEDQRSLDSLLGRGVLVSGSETLANQRCTMRLPDSEAAMSPSTNPLAVVPALSRLLITMIRLRHGRLGQALARLRTARKRLPRRPPTSGSLAEILAAFERTRMFVKPANQCLARSIALATALQRAGHRPELVFGVMARPFAAHCWVQLDGMVLNDRVDHVRTFTPILVI